MPKKPGRGPRKHRRGPGGSGSGGRDDGGAPRGGRPGGKGRRGGQGSRPGRPAVARKSDYFMQPGRQGVFIVLRRPIGNRADPKICGTMPSRQHAKLLVQQLERAESVVKDLFMEATDDGIEALEAVLAACRDEVMLNGPPIVAEAQPADGASGDEPAPGDADDESPYDESSAEPEPD